LLFVFVKLLFVPPHQEPEKPKEPQNEERSESKYMLPPLTEQQVRLGV
jgi:hypothetical protein